MIASPASVAAAFVEVAQRTPAMRAVFCSAQSLSFGQLQARALRVAQGLRGYGVAPGTGVVLAIPRSVESVVAVLGILLAGGFYVPIDPTYPAERQRFIAADCGAALVLTGGAQADSSPLSAALPHIDIGSLEAANAGTEALVLPPGDPTQALLCIIYTSGSTGRPKGVCVRQAGMLHRWRWGWQRYPFSADDVVAHRSSLNFLDSATELLGSLLQGVPVAIIRPEEVADLSRMVQVLAAHRVTRLTLVPSLLSAFLGVYPELGRELPRISLWISSGEVLSAALLRRFRAACPHATLLNLYGSTEISADVTCAEFTPQTALPERRVPIGSAVAGAELWVLGEDGSPVEAGATGELFVGGPILCRSYWQRPEEDQVRFVYPGVAGGSRLFRTGDRVRALADGQLEYLGRVDNQVKVNGVRIELEEIELVVAALLPTGGHAAAVAVPSPADPETRRLWLFVAPADIAVEPLRERMRAQLPPPLVPSRIMALAALPLVPSGKFDRQALIRQAMGIEQSPRAQPVVLLPDEQELAALYSTLLGIAPVSREDCFGALGGDSLALAQLLARLAARGVPAPALPPAQVRQAPLWQVARWLDGRDPVPADVPSMYEVVAAEQVPEAALARFAADLFVAREPVCVALGLTRDDVLAAFTRTVRGAQRLGLSLVARDPHTGELFGLSLVLDWADQPPPDLAAESLRARPYWALVYELCDEYERQLASRPAVGELLDMALGGAVPTVDGLALLYDLDRRVLTAARARGYRGAATLCFHEVTRHLAERLGFVRHTARSLTTYEYEGRRLLESAAPVHKEAVLMAKDLRD
ncbi:MAG: amino acid adenylation domain-containing protein [Nannocystis sp.]|nr:amino acid adenylation domain-containing protein [Nannocystis sp.]